MYADNEIVAHVIYSRLFNEKCTILENYDLRGEQFST